MNPQNEPPMNAPIRSMSKARVARVTRQVFGHAELTQPRRV